MSFFAKRTHSIVVESPICLGLAQRIQTSLPFVADASVSAHTQ